MCLAIPAKIVQLFDDESRALVEVAGVRRQIDTGLLAAESLHPDDWVLVHVGFAMSKISQEQALDQIRLLKLLGEEQAALEEVSGYLSKEQPPAAETVP